MSEIYNRAQKSLVGGVNSPVRSFSGVGSEPVFITKAKGAHLTDTDGNTYIDLIGSWGPLILGHDERIARAVAERAGQGLSYGLGTPEEVELAETIIAAVPSVEKIRFVNSGTEAVMSALRLARGYTNRDKIIKFRGAYHGHADSMLVEAGSGLLTHSTPSSEGVSASVAKDTLLAEYNDVESVRRLFEENPGEIAAIIVEPVAGNMGVVAPQPGFLEDLRRLTEENGALLIFDEVITGFRNAYGAYQNETGISPDLTVFGKIIGGGLPVGAFGGRREIMNHLSPLGGVYQAGTLSGNPVVMSAGKKALQILKEEDPYGKINEKIDRLEDGFNKLRDRYDLDLSFGREGTMFTLFFNKNVPTTYEEVLESDTKAYGKFFRAMLKRGVLIPPSQFESWFVGAAHTDEDINKILKAAEDSFEEMRESTDCS